MIFEQLFDTKSSTYTYIVSSGKGREALIIDPVIENINEYIRVLKNLDLKLVKVIDTHIHADHISGLNELSKRTKCSKIMGEHSSSEVVDIHVKDNEKIKIENIELISIYTPGHTDCSYSFLMNDETIVDVEKLVRDNLDGNGSLDLENKKLYDDGAIRLSNLEALSQAKTLILGDNEISDKGVAALCDSPYISQLKTLNLKSNKITAEGAKLISQSTNWSNLDQLVLKFNEIGEEGAMHLAKSEVLSNITTLDLFRNHIGSEGAKAIKSSPNLKKLSRVRLD